MIIRTEIIRTSTQGWRTGRAVIGSIKQWITSGIGHTVHVVRRAIGSMSDPLERVHASDQHQTSQRGSRDWLRQSLNLVFAIGQVVTTYATVATGTDQNFSSRTTSDPPIVPAPYTFYVIWSVIYASTIAYAIYQALPQQRANELLRRVGFWTAAAFASTSLWLGAAVRNWEWLTVAIFFGILAALLMAFVQLIRFKAPRTTAERYLVVLPISIYAAWATIGTIANTATALQSSGFVLSGTAAQLWAIIMLAIAGAIASFVATVSRGNLWYVLTVVWALAGIIVANAATFPLVSAVAFGAGVVVLIALLRARRQAYA